MKINNFLLGIAIAPFIMSNFALADQDYFEQVLNTVCVEQDPLPMDKKLGDDPQIVFNQNYLPSENDAAASVKSGAATYYYYQFDNGAECYQITANDCLWGYVDPGDAPATWNVSLVSGYSSLVSSGACADPFVQSICSACPKSK